MAKHVGDSPTASCARVRPRAGNQASTVADALQSIRPPCHPASDDHKSGPCCAGTSAPGCWSGSSPELAPTAVVWRLAAARTSWARTLGPLAAGGLDPPAVREAVRQRAKTDRNDALAILEAASRPSMQQVAMESSRTAGGLRLTLSARELLVGAAHAVDRCAGAHAAGSGWWRPGAPAGRRAAGGGGECRPAGSRAHRAGLPQPSGSAPSTARWAGSTRR